MALKLAFGVIGGLGLFLYGMSLMSDGLQKSAGDKLRRILEVLTSTAWKGVLVGTFVTAVIQSSSATTVMTVSFVNAGLMTLRQAIGIIMGANIGTTMTGQLIAFKITAIALPAVGVGFFISFLSRRKRWRYAGQVILGFGLLFLGMETMTEALKPLAHSAVFRNWIASFGAHPLLGILVGLGMTMTIQSSSATIGILMAVAVNMPDVVTLDVAIPILFGDNIGTCITAVLASIGTTLSARRAALSHVLFNVFGTILFMILFPAFKAAVLAISPAGDIQRQIANAHTMFNTLNTLVWLPMVGVLEAIVTRLYPGDEVTLEKGAKYLDTRILSTPSVALDLALRELVRMAGITMDMFAKARKAFETGDERLMEDIQRNEDLVDALQEQIVLYLSTALSLSVLTERQSARLAGMMHVAGDIERIGDLATDIAEYAMEKAENKLPFTDEAMADLADLFDRVARIYRLAIDALQASDENLAREVWKIENQIDEAVERLRKGHIVRLNEGKCFPGSGVVFVELVNNLERIADHAVNLADAAAGSEEYKDDAGQIAE